MTGPGPDRRNIGPNHPEHSGATPLRAYAHPGAHFGNLLVGEHHIAGPIIEPGEVSVPADVVELEVSGRNRPIDREHDGPGSSD